MIKRLTRHGNSLALIIDKAVLELLRITRDTPLEVSTDGTALVVTPVRDQSRAEAFEEALTRTNRRYTRMLKRLAG